MSDFVAFLRGTAKAEPPPAQPTPSPPKTAELLAPLRAREAQARVAPVAACARSVRQGYIGPAPALLSVTAAEAWEAEHRGGCAPLAARGEGESAHG